MKNCYWLICFTLISVTFFSPFNAMADTLHFLTGNPIKNDQWFLIKALELKNNKLIVEVRHGEKIERVAIHVSRILSLYFNSSYEHNQAFKFRKILKNAVFYDPKQLKTLYVTERFKVLNLNIIVFGRGRSMQAIGNIVTFNREAETLVVRCKKNDGTLVDLNTEIEDEVLSWVR